MRSEKLDLIFSPEASTEGKQVVKIVLPHTRQFKCVYLSYDFGGSRRNLFARSCPLFSSLSQTCFLALLRTCAPSSEDFDDRTFHVSSMWMSPLARVHWFLKLLNYFNPRVIFFIYSYCIFLSSKKVYCRVTKLVHWYLTYVESRPKDWS